MRNICPYCDYKKEDEPLSLDIMKVIHEDGITTEDYLLWFHRLIKQHSKHYGFKTYRGVKVHIGHKHKGKYNSPSFEFNEAEKELLKSYENIQM